jgi:hypothetical protein
MAGRRVLPFFWSDPALSEMTAGNANCPKLNSLLNGLLHSS